MMAGPAQCDGAVSGTGSLALRLARIRGRLADIIGDPDRVKVVAVTKGFGVDAVEAAMAAGLADLGENYAQELRAKAPNAPAGVRWHFLGSPQRNKVAGLASLVSLWQGVDRSEVLSALASRSPGAAVLIEVNLGREESKHGCAPADAPDLVRRGLDLGLDVRGLMTVAPRDRSMAKRCFGSLATLAGRLGLPELSMGMSDDFDLAAAEGATMLRLGRALFGPRSGPMALRR